MNIDLTTKLVLQKFAALIITLGAFVFLQSAYNFMLLTIVLGHSHFLLAYIYKIAAGKIKLKNAVLFVGIAIGLFAYYFRIDFPDFRIESLLLITAIGSIYHTLVDDQFTLNSFKANYSVFQKLQILILLTSVVGLHVSWQFDAPPEAALLIGAGFFLFSYYLIQKSRAKSSWSIAEYFFLFQWTLILGVYYSGIRFYFDRMLILSFVGMYHFFLYYFHYYTKIRSIAHLNPKPLNTLPVFLSIVIVSNALFGFLFFYNKANPSLALNLVFRYNPYLIITLMHVVSSLRLNEVSSVLNLKQT